MPRPLPTQKQPLYTDAEVRTVIDKVTGEILGDIFAEYPAPHEAGIIDAIDTGVGTETTTGTLTKKDIDAATEARWNAQVKSRLSDSGKLVVLGSRERDPLHTVPTREGGPRQH